MPLKLVYQSLLAIFFKCRQLGRSFLYGIWPVLEAMVPSARDGKSVCHWPNFGGLLLFFN